MFYKTIFSPGKHKHNILTHNIYAITSNLHTSNTHNIIHLRCSEMHSHTELTSNMTNSPLVAFYAVTAQVHHLKSLSTGNKSVATIC